MDPRNMFSTVFKSSEEKNMNRDEELPVTFHHTCMDLLTYLSICLHKLHVGLYHTKFCISNSIHDYQFLQKT